MSLATINIEECILHISNKSLLQKGKNNNILIQKWRRQKFYPFIFDFMKVPVILSSYIWFYEGSGQAFLILNYKINFDYEIWNSLFHFN